MAALVWEERRYEDGLSNGVFYPPGESGVAWNGLVSATESREDTSREEFYIDGVKYSELIGKKSFRLSVTALSEPMGFDQFVGEPEIWPGFTLTRQLPKRFDFSYRTQVSGEEGYRLHLIYQALAIRTSRSASTLGQASRPDSLEWNVFTRPVDYPSFSPTARVTIHSMRADSGILDQIETILYGSEEADARIIYPSELEDIYTA